MLQSIRDRSQGWLTGSIVAIICITFAFWGVHSYTGSSGTSDVVAKIDGHKIQQTDLNSTYQRLHQQQQMQLGAAFVMDQKQEVQLKRQALNQLIMTYILSQAAVQAGYRVTPDEVGAALINIPMFQVDGRFSRERFNEVLSNILYTENGFLADLKTTMLINQVRAGFLNSAFTLPSDITTAAKLVNQKRDLTYFIIPIERFNKQIQISEKDAQAYYKQHQADFTAPEQVSVEYIQLSLAQIAAQQHFSDDQLKQFYQNNLTSFTVPERWHVAHILVKVPEDATPQQVAEAKAKIDSIAQRLRAGGNFAQLAQDYSDDVLSARNGGVIDWFGPGMTDPSFEKAVAGLKQIGVLSPPVRHKLGFSVIKLIGDEKAQVESFEKAKDRVKKAFAQQKAEQVFADATDKLANLTYANPGSLSVAAKTLDLPIQATSLFGHQGGKDQITANPKVIDAAFNAEVLQGNNSNVVELDPNTLIVLRIKQHVPSALLSFDKVQDQVMQKLKFQTAKQQTQQLGQELLQQLQKGKSSEQVARQANFLLQVINGVGRFDNRVPGAVLRAAFRMPHPQGKILASEGFSLPNGDYALLTVTAVHDGSLGLNAAAQRRLYREELENGFGQLDYALYVRGLLSKTKIDFKGLKDKGFTVASNTTDNELSDN